jgi:hypothetical protein
VPYSIGLVITEQHRLAPVRVRTEQRAADNVGSRGGDSSLLTHLVEGHRCVVGQHRLNQRLGEQEAGSFKQLATFGHKALVTEPESSVKVTEISRSEVGVDIQRVSRHVISL